MSYLKRFFAVCITGIACTFFWSAPSVKAATCSISSDTVITQTYVTDNTCTAIDITSNVSTTWIGTVNLGGGTVTVKSGNTMTMGTLSTMTLGSTDDVVVESGATITQTQGDANGIRISARNISLYGSITANGKGCAGSATGAGYGPDPVTGVCALETTGYGLSASGGAGYGGRGGVSGVDAGASATYGSSTYPNLLGSGGSGGGTSGSGGGLIHLLASGILEINGLVSANGTISSGGAGSGGSIYIRSHELTGSGSIRANGSNADFCTYGGGGGGGRVAVYYQVLGTFPLGNILASGGTGDACRGAGNGEKGTTYILNGWSDTSTTDLRITSGIDLTPDLNLHHANITFDSGARINCGEARSSLEVSATGALTDEGAVWTCSANFSSVVVSSTGALTLNGTSLSFPNTDEFTFSASDFINNNASLTVSKSGSRGSLAIRNPSLTLTGFTFTGAANASTTRADGGTLSFPFTTALSLVNSDLLANVSTTLTTFSMDATSSLNANGKGCPGGPLSGGGLGPDPITGICTAGAAGAGLDPVGGAGYGGAGGGSAMPSGPSATYGSAAYPYFLGSSGSVTAAGGRILLDITGTATIEGTISANAVADGYSGGSGGSVNIRASTIMGGGSITANGANAGWCTYGGGGGGGRVSLRYQTLGTFDVEAPSVAGGSGDGCRGGSSGATGSVYTLLLNQSPDVPSSLNPSDLKDGSTTSTNTPIFSFNLSDPDGADTVKYRIIIDNTSDFSSPVVDYTSGLAAQGTRTFQVGQAAGSGTYAAGSESTPLPDGTYYWEVRAIDGSDAASSYTLARGSGLAAFLVDTVVRSVQFETATGSGLESVTASSVRIVLDITNVDDVTVSYAVTGGTATGSGTDYTLASGTATIPAGETSTTIPFTMVNDSILESNETFTVTLSSPSHASLGSNTTYTYTITDNETASISVTPTTFSLTRGGSAGSYTVVLGAAPTNTVQILLSVAAELTLSTSTLTFTGVTWATPQTVTVSPRNDGSFDTTAITHTITQTVSTTITGFAALTPSPVTVTLNAASSSGGTGGGGGVGAGGSSIVASGFAPVVHPIPVITVTFLDPSAVPAPTIEPLPNVPGLLTVVNPHDIQQVVERFNRGQRDMAREQTSTNQLQADLRSFKLTASNEQQIQDLVTFISYGLTEESARLGSGERRAIVRDALETLRTTNISPSDLERLVHGQIPHARNLAEERKQSTRALATFRTIYGHAPNFKNTEENLAWNTLMYRLRFPRNLQAETQGIQEFRTTFRRAPQDPFQWATVRVMGYVNR